MVKKCSLAGCCLLLLAHEYAFGAGAVSGGGGGSGGSGSRDGGAAAFAASVLGGERRGQHKNQVCDPPTYVILGGGRGRGEAVLTSFDLFQCVARMPSLPCRRPTFNFSVISFPFPRLRSCDRPHLLRCCGWRRGTAQSSKRSLILLIGRLLIATLFLYTGSLTTSSPKQTDRPT